MSALPRRPALPEHSTDSTGVQTGNADIADSSQWQPPTGEPERPTLPGCEHEPNLPKVWPWLTESRAFALVAVLAVIAAALRLGGLS